MRKCIRCDVEMLEDYDVKVEGGVYGLKITKPGIFKDNLGKVHASVCPECGYLEFYLEDVFCKPFLHKIAKSFCRLLHLHFVGNCKTSADSYSASHKPLQIIFSCYNTRYGNGSSEFSSSCACSLK